MPGPAGGELQKHSGLSRLERLDLFLLLGWLRAYFSRFSSDQVQEAVVGCRGERALRRRTQVKSLNRLFPAVTGGCMFVGAFMKAVRPAEERVSRERSPYAEMTAAGERWDALGSRCLWEYIMRFFPVPCNNELFRPTPLASGVHAAETPDRRGWMQSRREWGGEWVHRPLVPAWDLPPYRAVPCEKLLDMTTTFT